MKTGITVIDHKEVFYDFLDGYFGGNFINNVRRYEKLGKLSFIPDDIEFDEENGNWCGTLYFDVSKMTPEELINDIIAAEKADEISLENGVLRLWWD